MQTLAPGFFIVASLALVSAGSGFLQHVPEKSLTQGEMQVMLDAIDDALGENHRRSTEMRLGPIVEMLAPTLKSLPKNEHGKFGHKSVRFALSRLFVQRHGWFVKGTDSNQNSSNATPTAIFQGDLSGQVQSLFESKLGARGLSEHDIAVMAATFESLVHRESMERLRLAYKLLNVAPGANNLTTEVVDKLLDLYFALFRTIDITLVLSDELSDEDDLPGSLIARTTKKYNGYGEARSFARQVRNESTSGRVALSSVDVAHIITRIGDRYGRWQNRECEDIRRELLFIEDDGTGRVPNRILRIRV